MNINYEMVDLGLPSGTLWTKCNLGAEKETDCGLYFQWGSTEGYTKEQIENSEREQPTKELMHSQTILDEGGDAVSKYMGSKYRMPTKEDFHELLDNTISEWVENYNNSGKNGRKFVSKRDNSKYIFIPCSGIVNKNSILDLNTYIYLWSSSLYTPNPTGSYCFYSDFQIYKIAEDSSVHGFNLRGISK